MARDRKFRSREERRATRHPHERLTHSALAETLRLGREFPPPQVRLHVGPANSGKTYDSIERLKNSPSGTYLAPLRLLAWEIADKLNTQGHPCNLITGEERVIHPNAAFVSCTVEMFNPEAPVDCIVLDEAQMIADKQRGWAWLRAIVNARCQKLEIIASLDAEKLLSQILTKIEFPFEVIRHERLAPLTVAAKPWRIDDPQPSTIFVVFSRAGVLSLKTYFERRGFSVSAIYGNLPPEVKKKQAERFLNEEAQLCVATDAIGMGMNLPAARVCFTSVSKYDGEQQRNLLPSEARQIAGRAGRFGIKEKGEAGALSYENLSILNRLLNTKPPDLEFARISPELSEIEKMDGPLSHRLFLWEKRYAIPEHLKDVLMPADLEQQKALASLLKDHEVEKMGLPVAFQLIKAPASRDTVNYWHAIVRSFIENRQIPQPLSLQGMAIENEDLLLAAEQAVEQCDIYLWTANQPDMKMHALEREKVMTYKWELIEKIDQALSFKMDMRQKCKKCEKILPLLHRFSVCEPCHRASSHRFFSRPKHRRFRPPPR